MNKTKILIMISICLLGCQDKGEHLIYYQYDNQFVTRIDYARTSLFFGVKLKSNDLDKQKWIMKVDYPGFDNDFVCYVSFASDSSITFYRVYGQYDRCMECKDVNLVDDHIYDYERFTGQRLGEINTVCMASALKTEKDLNMRKETSKVQVEYVY